MAPQADHRPGSRRRRSTVATTQRVSWRIARSRRRLREQLGGSWHPRKPVKRTGASRFVMVEDELALLLMRCAFEHAVTWPLLWAVLWRCQTTKVHDAEAPTSISVEDLVAQTGYARATVYRGLRELLERKMVLIESGGGRHRKSAFRVTSPEDWLL